jgi:hypothetical protein
LAQSDTRAESTLKQAQVIIQTILYPINNEDNAPPVNELLALVALREKQIDVPMQEKYLS